MFHTLACGSSRPGGQLDVYRAKQGYYCHCRKIKISDDRVIWERQFPLPKPDERIGFPWTIKDWNKVRNKRAGRPVDYDE